MRTLFLLLLALSAVTLLPVSLAYSQSSSNSSNTCGVKITQLENQLEVIFSPKIVHFIESNTTAFKSLQQKYSLYWLNTIYSWNNDVSKCSAQLQSVTASFEMLNSTRPNIGVAHITVDASVTKVLNVKIDMPNAIVPVR
jgi:hypothetical protein